MTMSRRMILAGLSAGLGSAALANAPDLSVRPVARSTDLPRIRPRSRQGLAEMIAEAGLTGQVGVVLADARTGDVIDSVDGNTPRPPASVTKAVTALYALEALGPEHRFSTQLIATGPVIDGVLEGDLILAGGGDPTLVTDDVAGLAQALKAAGLTEVRGTFRVWGGAVRGVDEIDASQLDHLGYNPSVSGLNLNFNRVHFEWKREGDSYSVALDARSETHRPSVTTARMQIVDRAVPIYTYRDAGGVDSWTVARKALGNAGSRWLPVRYPALYAGEVFQTFARSAGIVLTPPQVMTEEPAGDVIVAHQSDTLREIMRGMLRFSTNLTAEAAGLAATEALTGEDRGLRTSAFGMTRWASDRADIAPMFVDHSGLGDASRITASDMVRLLTADAVRDRMAPILKPIAMVDSDGKRIPDFPGLVQAKTGTLNFVSTLAGYVTTQAGRPLAFAIFCADLEARERGKQSADEQPAGAAGFNTRAKRLQQTILQRWSRT